MPTIEKLSIALPTEMATIVRQAVEAGEYSSQSEVVRDALRDWTHKRRLRAKGLAEMRKAWAEAVADDSEGEDPATVLDALESRYDARANAPGRECA